MRATLAGALILLGGIVPAAAQFTTPIVDGLIATNEYGIHSDGANRYANGSQTWYMTWDATKLYVAIVGAITADGAIVYLDVNPIAPINGGTDANGTLAGQPYDNTNFAALPFRADRVLYFKDGTRELRSAVSGGWSAATTLTGDYASIGLVREFTIPWSSLGGRPIAFAWFGYVTNASGSVYAEMPMENASGAIGTAARYERYYTINGTDDGNSTWPFARNSYIFNRTADWVDVGMFNVYDFTMNSPGRTLTRGATNATWIMSGNLHVEAGTISFGNSYGSATVDCDVIVGNAGTLTLSSNTGGDLMVQRHLQVNGTFTHNGRRVTFAGPLNQTITAPTTFADLTISKSGGAVSVAQNVRVLGTLTLVVGHARLTNSASMIIGENGNITGASVASHIKTLGTGSLQRERVGSSTTSFPVGTDASYNPVAISNAGTADAFSVRVGATFDPPVPGNLLRVVNRQWIISEGTLGGSNATLTFQWNAAEHGTLFNPASPVSVLQNVGAQWSEILATVNGTGPYIATARGVGLFNRFGVGNSGATDVRETIGAPKEFALAQNYPNPFNPSTEIKFSVDRTERVALNVYNPLGQRVATVFDGVAEPEKFYSVTFDATSLASGMYFYKLQSGSKTATKKMIVTK
jgi:hypothetical protein